MARQVSDEAFSEFVHGAWPGLYRTAYLLLGDAGLAEDLVQTALAKTHATWPSVRDVGRAGVRPHDAAQHASSWFRKRR
jgi:DNA-directed RNA polymerase specialized sigma24 family protein